MSAFSKCRHPARLLLHLGKYTWLTASLNLLNYKIIGVSKNFKNQLRPLVRPGSVNFCQNFWNLSHETVPLNLFFWTAGFSLIRAECFSCSLHVLYGSLGIVQLKILQKIQFKIDLLSYFEAVVYLSYAQNLIPPSPVHTVYIYHKIIKRKNGKQR